jgi:NADH-quinone oxidoreductase subunit J
MTTPFSLAAAAAAAVPSLEAAPVPAAGPGLFGASSGLVAPGLLFLLCAAAAVGMMLLLPGRKEKPIRVIGGVLLLAAMLILAVVIGKTAGGVGVYFWIFSAIAIVGAIRVVTHPKPVYSALYFVLKVMASAGLFVLMWAQFMAAALVLIYGGAILVTYVFVIMLAAEAQPESTGTGGGMHEQLAEHDAISREPVVASAVGFALLGVLLFVIFDTRQVISREEASGGQAAVASAAATPPSALPAAALPAGAATPAREVPAQAVYPGVGDYVPQGGTQKLGHYLFTNQLVNLELAGLILTIAMVGAIVIARKRVVNPQQAIDQGVVAAGEPSATAATAPLTPMRDDPDSIPVYGTENPRQKEYPET